MVADAAVVGIPPIEAEVSTGTHDTLALVMYITRPEVGALLGTRTRDSLEHFGDVSHCRTGATDPGGVGDDVVTGLPGSRLQMRKAKREDSFIYSAIDKRNKAAKLTMAW